MKRDIFFMIPSIGGGGAERVFVNLVNNINKELFNVTLVYLTDKNKEYEIEENVRMINLGTNRVRNAPLKIIRLIKLEKPDLIISTLGHLNIMLLTLKVFFPKNTKVIVRQTNIMSLSKRSTLNKLIHNILIKLYTQADKIICQSEYMKNDFINITGIRKNVVKIYNPVDIDNVLQKSKDNIGHEFKITNKNIFFVGRLDEVKRIPLIIDSFQKFHVENNKSSLYILGEGPKRKELEEYIEKKKLSESVKLLDFQENPYKWLKHADLFIMASKHEGMPNILLESLALEIPVLIKKHPGGTREIMRKIGIEDRYVDDLIISDEYFNDYKGDIRPKLVRYFDTQNITKYYEKLFVGVLKED